MVQSKKTQNFRATIYKVGVNRCVDVPERVSGVLRWEKYIPVKEHVEDMAIRSTLVPRGDSKHRLFIPSRIWRKLGVDTGDTINASIMRDKASREVRLPEDIAAALRQRYEARAAFDTLTTAMRRSFVANILEARKPETRKKRIQQGIERIIEYKKGKRSSVQ